MPPQPERDRSGVRSAWDGCIGCFSWIVVAVLALVLVGWVLSC